MCCLVHNQVNGRHVRPCSGGPWANGGTFDGVQLVGRDTADRAGVTVSAISTDFALRIPTRFSLGFMKSWDNRVMDNASHLFGASGFGHSGFGGSIGFADPEAAMSFGYAMNCIGIGAGLNERGQSVVDATYRSLGYRSNASGGWRR